MDVVAAGVHHADLLAEVLGAHGRLERVGRVLGDRERVHVRADGDHRPRRAPSQQPHHTGFCHAGRDLEPETLEVLGDELGGLELAIAELRVLVNPMSQLRDLREHPFDLGSDPFRLADGGRGSGEHQENRKGPA